MSSHTISLTPENKLAIQIPYDPGLISRAKEIPFHRYEPLQKQWLTDICFMDSVIDNFPGFARSTEVEELYTKYKKRELEADNLSKKLLNNFNTTEVNGRILFKHQIDGVKKILYERRLILADEMGLGKSCTSLVAAILTGLPIYIIAPKSLHINWQRECALLGIEPKQIISWAKIPRTPTEPFFCIMDECHAMQSMIARRSKKAIEFTTNASYVVAISGTPIKNGRPSNLFGILCAVKHPLSFQRRAYEQKYCAARKTRYSKWDCTGASNLQDLYKSINNILLRRDKESCLDLPDKMRTLRVAELTPEAGRTYWEVFNKLRLRWLNRVRTGEIISNNEKLIMFTQLRHAASWAKLHEAIKLAEELNENNKQVIFFLAFTDSASDLSNKLKSIAPTGLITGDISFSDRQKAIDNFQAGVLKFMVCTFGAGGVGINLTAAHHVILIDRAWAPAECIQSEDRAHRIGQNNTVFVDWLQCNGCDLRIDELLLQKQKNISQILTGDKDTIPLDFDIREKVDVLFDSIFS